MLSMECFVARMGAAGEIVAKLGYLNPLGSSKDRVAFNLIKSAENVGKIRQAIQLLKLQAEIRVSDLHMSAIFWAIK